MNPTTSLTGGTTATPRPPERALRAWPWIRARLFQSPAGILGTLLCLWLLLMTVPPLVDWLLVKATFSSPTAQGCRNAPGGACWAFIAEKHRLILFGTYPYDEQWRPLLATLALIGTLVYSAARRTWDLRLTMLWIGVLALVAVLMWGGLFGLSYVENVRWGGLPLTLILSTFGIAFAFPLGVVLALGRRSRMPAIKALCVGYIELIRGVPLISILFMSSVMLPLFMQQGVTIDKLLRAQVAIILFAAAYIAEVVRAGLQAMPHGQEEAAKALGLGYWRTMQLIVLPQALRKVIPGLVNLAIGFLLATSLLAVIGILDLLNAARASTTDPKWLGFYDEAYLVVAVIYFVFCFSLSKYSRSLERSLATGHASDNAVK